MNTYKFCEGKCPPGSATYAGILKLTHTYTENILTITIFNTILLQPMHVF